MREEMGKVFARLDEINRADNAAAKKALQNQGITFVTPKPGEVEQWREISEKSVDEMLDKEIISADIVNQVRDHLKALRNNQ